MNINISLKISMFAYFDSNIFSECCDFKHNNHLVKICLRIVFVKYLGGMTNMIFFILIHETILQGCLDVPSMFL